MFTTVRAVIASAVAAAVLVMLPGSTPVSAGAFSVAGAWHDGAPMPTARTEVTSAFLDGVIYVGGGFPGGGNTARFEAYDIGDDSWSQKADLPQSLDHAGAAAVGGRVYVVGGYEIFSQGIISPDTFEYDPVADDWTARATMPLLRAASATVAVDGIIYVLGGVGPQATVPLAYDPVADSWDQLAPMSAQREHLTASVVDGKIYVIGGRQNVTQNVGTVEVYDPVADDWDTLTPMPTARGGLTSGTVTDRIHVVGGEDLSPGGSTFAEHEVYDPVLDSWGAAADLPTARHGLTAQVVNGKFYVIGGGPTPAFSVSGAVEIFVSDAVGGIAELEMLTPRPRPRLRAATLASSPASRQASQWSRWCWRSLAFACGGLALSLPAAPRRSLCGRGQPALWWTSPRRAQIPVTPCPSRWLT